MKLNQMTMEQNTFKDPYELINLTYVMDTQSYEAFLRKAETYPLLVLDCETVGKTAIPLFEYQEKQEGILEKILHTHGFEYENYNNLKNDLSLLTAKLKSKYNVKSIAITKLLPEDRAEYKELQTKIKELKKSEFLEIPKLEKDISDIQSKINSDRSGLNFNENILSLIQINTPDYQQFFIDPEILDERFEKLLQTRQALIGHNLKFDLIQMFKHKNINLFLSDVVIYDTMIAMKVLYAGILRSFGLKECVQKMLLFEQSKEERVSNWLRRPLTKEQEEYGCLDVITPMLLFERIKQEVRDEDLVDVIKMQMEFVKYLSLIESNGIYVNLDMTEDLIHDIEFNIIYLVDKIGEVLGDPDLEKCKQTGSPKETLELLNKYGEKINNETLINLTSTSADHFDSIPEKIDILQDISTLRSYIKTKQTCVYHIQGKHVNSRIHSSYQQFAREGTRMSSSDPNVQNWSQPGELPDNYEFFIDEIKKWEPSQRIRTLAENTPDYNLYDADYGQIELCMIAFYSQDEAMIKAITEGVDLHSLTANTIFKLGAKYDDFLDPSFSKLFKKKYKRERFIGKTYNFSCGYGAGPNRLLQQMREGGIYDVDFDQSKEWKTIWYDQFFGVKIWQDNQLSFVHNFGYTVTRMGRKIYFSDPKNQYSKIFNTPIQASCYEGLQQSVILFYREVRNLVEKGLIELDDIRICNLIHDEIYAEAHKKINKDSMVNLITKSMINGIQPLMQGYETEDVIYKSVPVRVDCSPILRWSDKA